MIERIFRKLGILRPLYQPPRFRHAPGDAHERALEQEVREQAARLEAARKDKALYNVAEDVTHPTRTMARLIRRARERKLTREQAAALTIRPMEKYLARVYGEAS